MSSLRITCFGNFRVELENGAIAKFDTDKARALLVYLAVAPGRPYQRSHLAGLLWSDQPDDSALHNLRQTLSYLRKALNESASQAPFIITDHDTIQLNTKADIWVDIIAFNQALEKAYRFYKGQNGRGWVNIRCLHRALDIYQKPIFDRFNLNNSALYDEWATLTCEDYNHQAIEALALISEYHERRGEYVQARQAAARIVELAPWDETAHSQVMRLLAIDGQWSMAQNQYAVLRRYLADQMGVEPTQETKILFEKIRNAASENTSLQPRFPISPHHFPTLSTPFVGREQDLDRLTEMVVDPECRLLTLLGPGGIGKTRLALEIATQQLGIFPDGVFYVPLISARSMEQIVLLVLEVMSLPLSDQADPRTQLLDRLREKHLLLVLDNFEHLLADRRNPDLLAEILAHAPGLILLVTSRARLDLQEEWIYPLGGLDYPKNISQPTQHPESFDALTLFTRRASQVQHEFKLSADNLATIIRICQSLEGLPLGIELAAAALWNQTCSEIAEKIERDFDLLQSSALNIQPRHRSLRAVFDISWQLLTPAEQDVFCRLSVFNHDFDLEAARQIANASPDMLSSLLSKSLLRRDPGGRYDLHETIRQYAAEKLANMLSTEGLSALDITRSIHARYYHNTLVNLGPALQGAHQAEALAAIRQDFENFQQAWDWMIEKKMGKEIGQIVDSLYLFFSIYSRFADGIEWFQNAVHMLGQRPSLELGMVLSRLGALAYIPRQNALAFEALERSREILTHLEEPHELAFCLLRLGGVYLRKKNFESAQACAHESLDLYRLAGDKSGESRALYLSGLILSRLGNDREAKPLLNASVIACRETGNQRHLIAPLNVLGDIACNEGDYDKAAELFEESLGISRQLDDYFNQAILLNNLGTVYQTQMKDAQAKLAYEESLSICHHIGDQDGEAIALNNLGEMAVSRGNYSDAIPLSEKALQIAQQLQEDWTIIICLNNLGEALCGLGEYVKSREYLIKGLQMASMISAADLTTRIAVNLGRLYQLQGNTQTAISLYQASLAHSSTEHAVRVKAIGYLDKLNIDTQVQEDDQMLDKILSNHLSL